MRFLPLWFKHWLMEREIRFMTDDEIVDDMVRRIRLNQVDLLSWDSVAREDLIKGHHTTGRNIRNHYKLWQVANPHTVNDDAGHDRFPDQVSHAIMERVWDRLHGRGTP